MRDILFVTVDSLRADHVGWHGYGRETTPNLDSLADTGHVLRRAFANGCGTSRSFPSIMSSTYPMMYGGYEVISEDRPLLADVLQSAGYRTAGLHSNPYLLEKFGYGRGFDRYFTSESDTDALGAARQWIKNTFDDDNPVFRALKWAFDQSEKKAGFNPGTPFVRADDLTDKAIEWAESMDGDRPRFLWPHYMDVHHPYAPSEAYQRQFREDTVSERRAVKLRRKMLEDPEDVTDAELRTITDLYDAEIRYFDEHAARLVDAIRDRWGDDTVVAFTSDHGDELNDHGDFSHYNTYYDELLHVPLLFDVGDGGGTHDELVELLDVAPTLVDYAGVDVPERFEGNSLRTLFETPDEWSKSHAIAEAADSCACRTDRWKYVRDENDGRLYDLEADPDEETDVREANPEAVEELESVLADHQERVDETGRELGEVTIDDDTAEHLEQLGYR